MTFPFKQFSYSFQHKLILGYPQTTRKFIRSLKEKLYKQQSIINSLRYDLDKQVKDHNALSRKYLHLDQSASVLMNFKNKRAAPLLKRSRLMREQIQRENIELVTLFWMLIEERDILVDFLYRVYCRHRVADFSYLGDYSGGLLRRLHRRFLDEFGSDTHPGACWNLPRVHSIPCDLPPGKLKFYKDKFVTEVLKKSVLYEPDG